MRTAAAALVGVMLGWAAPATAEDAEVDVSAIRARSDRELDCLEDVSKQLERTIRLMQDARAQMRSRRADTRARRDAARAVQSLEQQLAALSSDLDACLEQDAGTASGDPGGEVKRRTEDGRPVVYVQQPRGPTEKAVAERNQATDAVEQNERLSANVAVKVGELVDGHGRAEPANVRSAVEGISGRLEQCYAQLLERHGLRRGTAIIVFTVAPSGAVRNVRAEQVEVGGDHFARCLRRAGRELEVAGRPEGGKAIYSYTLKFGPKRR